MKSIEERADRAIYDPTDGHPQEQPEIELDKFANKIDAFTERYKNNPERISIKGTGFYGKNVLSISFRCKRMV